MRFLFIYLFPVLLFSQDTEKKEKQEHKKDIHRIEWNTNLLFETNGLDKQFLNKFLYGGYISDDLKDNWINLGSEKNIIYSEINNNISYSNLEYNIGISLADRNILNASFTDDLMRLLLFGNFNYQDKTIDFSNTSIRINRFQQYKVDYTYKLKNTNIYAAISYLAGNSHASFIIRNGTLYTANTGAYLDIQYDINATITDTSDLSLFTHNGNGIAFDINVNFTLKENKINFYIEDLGYIKWKEESINYNTDSNFVFNGVEIEDIFSFNDSILDQYNSDNYLRQTKSTFKSYIPANIGLSILHPTKNKRIQSFSAGINIKWHPYEDNEVLSFSKITQGIQESNYTPLLWMSIVSNTKYLDVIPSISYGGYSDDINIGMALSKGEKRRIILGTQHLEDIFNGNNSKALSVYFQILTHF